MKNKTKSARRGGRFTEEFRAKVIADAERLGPVAAAREHGVGISTLYEWRAKARGQERQTCRVEEGNDPSPSVRGEVPSSLQVNVAAASSGDEPTSTTRFPKPAKRYTPSQRQAAIEFAREHGVAAAADKFGVSRFSVYAWLRKVQKNPSSTAESGDVSSTSDSGDVSSTIEAQRDAEILDEYRRHPGLGPSQICNQLRRKNIKASVNTVRRVMEEAGYRPPKVSRRPHDRRYEAIRPNHLWHLDFLHRHINRANTFTLILLDDCSRFVVGHGVDDAERADMVIATFEEAVAKHGKPERVMHDRGSAFWSWRGISRFTALLTELGIDQVVAVNKETNGKVENFNGNLAKELFDVHRFYDLAEMKRRLEHHLHWYNHVRTHQGLGGLLVPADRYYGREREVLARIEAGVGPEDDPLNLRARNLALFSVCSRNGEVEVSLMGQRLLVLRAQDVK